MTDIRVSFQTFEKLINSGFYSKPIFETASFVVTSCANFTVFAKKPTKGHAFRGSYPYNMIGYVGISMGESGKFDKDVIFEEVRDLINRVEDEDAKELLDILKAYLNNLYLELTEPGKTE